MVSNKEQIEKMSEELANIKEYDKSRDNPIIVRKTNEMNLGKLYSLIEKIKSISNNLWLWDLRDKKKLESFQQALKQKIVKFEIERIESRKEFADLERAGESISYGKIPILKFDTLTKKEQEEQKKKKKTNNLCPPFCPP